MKEKSKETISVRVDAEVLERVRSYANEKRLHLTGFISTQLSKIMDRIEKRKSMP